MAAAPWCIFGVLWLRFALECADRWREYLEWKRRQASVPFVIPAPMRQSQEEYQAMQARQEDDARVMREYMQAMTDELRKKQKPEWDK